MNADFTVANFAEVINLSKPTVWKYISTGSIRAYRMGKSVRIPFTELDRIRNENRVECGS